MPLTAYQPQDLSRYKRHEASREFSPEVPPGRYVFVQNCAGVVWIAPNRIHMHPQVLGRALPAVAAGELELGPNSRVIEINNCSGTFECAADCLFTAVGGLIAQGATISADAIQVFEV